MKKNYGFQSPIISPDDYVLGSGKLGNRKKILNPDRDWMPYLPLGEYQSRIIETFSCTQFATLNAIETLERRLWQINSNHAERPVAIGSENGPSGNDPHKVAEWIRKNGLNDEKELPFDDSIMSLEQYMSPNPLTKELMENAKKWLKTRSFLHEYVFTGGSIQSKQEKLLEALLYSPVGVSVDAWQKNGNVYTKTPGSQDNHWTLLVSGEKGKPWHVFDSYYDDDFIKELDWNYDFGIAKFYVINEVQIQVNWLCRIICGNNNLCLTQR